MKVLRRFISTVAIGMEKGIVSLQTTADVNADCIDQQWRALQGLSSVLFVQQRKNRVV